MSGDSYPAGDPVESRTSSMPDIDALVARAWNGDACADAEGNCLGCGRPVDRVAEQIDCPVCFAFLDWLWKGDRRDASFPAIAPISARYLPWDCAWCGYRNEHFGVVCDRCQHYGQPPAEPTGHRCFWGYGRRERRCKDAAVRAVDTPTTRGYYCADHALVAERLLAGADR